MLDKIQHVSRKKGGYESVWNFLGSESSGGFKEIGPVGLVKLGPV